MGCEDEDAVRVPELREGASLRVVFPDPLLSFFNFENPETSRVQFDLYTQNSNIDSVNIYATFTDVSEVPSVTYPITPAGQPQRRQLVKTYRQSDFDSEGALRNATITLGEVAAAMGLELSDIEGADVVNFYNQVVLTDGRRFPEAIPLPDDYNSNTVTPDIEGRGVQTSSFNAGFTAFVACPLPAGFATGRYRIEQIAGEPDPFSGAPGRFAPMQVNLTQTSPIGRTFSPTYYGFDARTFNFNLVCGDLIVPPTGAGLSCGGPSLGWRAAPTPGEYDVASDDVLILEILDNPDGACGLTVDVPLTLRLTKVE
ncbi:secreted protein with Por secretion system C-terminal sorting domain [Flammeovirgaceae bacterium 311]|nr:secreted protein with Por secretion system C-terminal sorting domain [Flammeovirgaceae bacterium 311]